MRHALRAAITGMGGANILTMLGPPPSSVRSIALGVAAWVSVGCGSQSPAGDFGPGSDAASDATGASDTGAASTPDAEAGGGGGDTGAATEGGGPSDAAGEAATGSDAGADGGPTVFSQCRFHFGTNDSTAQSGGSSLLSQLDLFTAGWIGSDTTFNLGSVCDETNPGGPLEGKVPALVSYIIAFTGRNAPGWCLADCNANNAGCSPASDLCTKGADYIRQNFTSRILPVYATFAQGFATACGTSRPIIWEMEPDYYQYYQAAQGGGARGQPGGPLSGQEAASYMSQMIATVKKVLPNAVFSMDISPWWPNNGCPGADPTTDPGWFSFFDMSQFTFVSTSGGGTLAASPNIRAGQSTWAGVHMCSGNKPILADTGYGVAGASTGPDPNWDDPTNINARIADGVISIMQYNPDPSSWGSTISSTRPQLNATACY
jgi:hypothetical protein